MSTRTPHTWSIHRRVLGWLTAGMALVFAANLISSYYSNREAADSAYDRLLLASTAQDRVFYVVSAPDGSVVTGYEDLPSPPEFSAAGNVPNPYFYDTRYKGAPVRVVALKSFVSGNNLSGFASIRVAQTRGERDSLAFRLLQQSAIWTLAIAVAGAIAVWLGISYGLRPLDRLNAALGRRSPEDVRPVVHDVPNEFKPLVSAVNGMLMRIDEGLSSMRHFISDASHQLKTPLAGLQAQTQMALRETDSETIRDSLAKVDVSVRRTSRLAQQLLSHARAAEPTGELQEVDLVRVAKETVSLMTPQALARNIDLGYEGTDSAPVSGDPTLLEEMMMNLADNALRYSPPGARVTLSVHRNEISTSLVVDDNGPGIPVEKRKEVFERFVRLPGSQAEGCGLGLAIVQEIAVSHGARAVLEESPHGGLRVRIELPYSRIREE